MICLNLKKGVSLPEVLVFVGIVGIISYLTVSSFFGYKSNQSLEKSVLQVATALERAKNLATSSKNGSQYGVHFSTDRVIVFQGSTYSQNSPNNETFMIDQMSQIGTTTFYGGGDVVFERLVGNTSNFGTSTIFLKNQPSKTKDIFVNNMGIVKY